MEGGKAIGCSGLVKNISHRSVNLGKENWRERSKSSCSWFGDNVFVMSSVTQIREVCKIHQMSLAAQLKQQSTVRKVHEISDCELQGWLCVQRASRLAQ
mmetsp:Transcript_6912/g.9555  ORF Transcript_6912/g.9555 Transcript_6912/m.9555 type:complete len:99 (-) Transcript_6912:166-462(-)